MNRQRRLELLSALLATAIMARCVGRCHAQTTNSTADNGTFSSTDQTSSYTSNSISLPAIHAATTADLVATTSSVDGSQTSPSADEGRTNQTSPASVTVTAEAANVSDHVTQPLVPDAPSTSTESNPLPSPSSSLSFSAPSSSSSSLSTTTSTLTLTTTTSPTVAATGSSTPYIANATSSLLSPSSTQSLVPDTPPTTPTSLTADISPSSMTSQPTAATEFSSSSSNSSRATIFSGPTTTTNTSRISSTIRPNFTGWVVSSVKPLYGPEAGGTVITVTGEWLNASSTCKVMLGRNNTLLLSRSFDRITVGTLPMAYTGNHLVISVICDNVLNITGFSFTYRQNPIVFDLQPRDHISSGGTHMNVSGSNMDASATPKITLSTVLTTTNTSTVIQSIQECLAASGVTLTCPMPPVDLSLLPNGSVICTGRPLTGAVASICAPDGADRADIFLGLQFDGYTNYSNITTGLSDMAFVFHPPPSIEAGQEVLTFNPRTDTNITVKGVNMQRGCRIEDYTATIGAATCQPIELTDTSFAFRPPAEQPANAKDATLCGTHLNVVIRIGFAVYHYACLDYKLADEVKAAEPSNNNNLAYISLLAILVIVGIGAGIRAHYCVADPDKERPDSPIGKYSQLPLRRSVDAHQSFVNDAYDDAFHMDANPTSPPTSPTKTCVTADVHEPPVYSEVKRAVPNGDHDLVSVI